MHDEVDLPILGKRVIGIGMDLIQIARIERIVLARPGFLDRVFTTDERDYCYTSVNPWERLSARFAAKEAVLKVLGTGLGGTSFRSIEIGSLPSGQPTLAVGGAGGDLAQELGIESWLVTMTHSELTAGAFVAGLGAE